MNGGFFNTTSSSNSIAPLTGSFKTNLTITAKPIPVRPKKIKVPLQSTSPEDPMRAAVAK